MHRRMHGTWRRGPLHAPMALSANPHPFMEKLEYPRHAEGNTSSLLHHER